DRLKTAKHGRCTACTAAYRFGDGWTVDGRWGRGPRRWISGLPTSINPSPMRIDQVVGQGKPTISFEFFPPKNEAGFAALYKAIDELHPLHPTYVSVTYGAGGSTRSKTVELVEKIQNELKIRAMAHLTCVG